MNEQIQILFKGIRRKISEKQYSKIRHFPYQPLSARHLEETFIVKDQNSLEQNIRQLEDKNEQLKQMINKLLQQNEQKTRALKKSQKILRIMPKKKRNENEQLNLKDFERYQEFLLGLEVIELEQELNECEGIYSDLIIKSRQGCQNEVSEIQSSKSKLLEGLIQLISEEKMPKYLNQVNKIINNSLESIRQNSLKLSSQIKMVRKQKTYWFKQINQIDLKSKECESELRDIQKKKREKDPSQFISTKGGEMKNVRQLEFEIETLKNENQEKEKELQSKMEQIIIKKIELRNSIEKFSAKKLYLNDYLIHHH